MWAHGLLALRSEIQGLSLSHHETLTEKAHETILYTSRTSTTHDSRPKHRGPQQVPLGQGVGHMVRARCQVRALGRNNSAHEQRSTARGSPQRAPANLRCVGCVKVCRVTITKPAHHNPLYIKHLTHGVSGVSGVSAFSSSLSGFSKQVFFFIN